jgi:hypothetical protein
MSRATMWMAGLVANFSLLSSAEGQYFNLPIQRVDAFSDSMTDLTAGWNFATNDTVVANAIANWLPISTAYELATSAQDANASGGGVICYTRVTERIECVTPVDDFDSVGSIDSLGTAEITADPLNTASWTCTIEGDADFVIHDNPAHPLPTDVVIRCSLWGVVAGTESGSAAITDGSNFEVKIENLDTGTFVSITGSLSNGTWTCITTDALGGETETNGTTINEFFETEMLDAYIGDTLRITSKMAHLGSTESATEGGNHMWDFKATAWFDVIAQ